MENLNVSLPFIDTKFSSFFLRTFHKNISKNSLYWHKDEFDRNVKVISGIGWKIQMDNQLPVNLSPGDSLKISKNVFHRIIKENEISSLVLKITEDR